MKFLENAKLEALNSALSVNPGDCRLDIRIESYSCKMVQNDKRLLKEVLQAEGPDTSPHDLQPLSPPVVTHPWRFSPQNLSPAGRHSRSVSDNDEQQQQIIMCDSISRKMLFDLVTLLNTTFPDYEFSAAKSEQFTKFHDLDAVVRSVDTQLGAVVDSFNSLRADLWALLDEEIVFKECNVYSYNPDYSSDPFSEDGCIWSFNYFFYNKRLKRILFFACRALSVQGVADDNEMEDEPMWNLDD